MTNYKLFYVAIFIKKLNFAKKLHIIWWYMTLSEAIENRHSVRAYTDREIEEEKLLVIGEETERCNKESGLNLQLVLNEPKAFDSTLAHYGKFSGVRNYIACVGKKDKSLAEKVGYYGERLVLLIQTLGLNSCWVALTFRKIPGSFTINKEEKLVCLIAFGYGRDNGKSHKIKKYSDVCDVKNPPLWLENGVKASLLAPTSVNQQKFFISSDKEGKVTIRRKGLGIYTKIDLGIVKYHFEVGSQTTI